MSLPGVASFYATVSFFGVIVAYFILPETEGRTLEDIELHFSVNSRKLTDRKIEKNAAGKNPQISDGEKPKLTTISEKSPSVIDTMTLNDQTNIETGKNTGIYNKSYSADSWV